MAITRAKQSSLKTGVTKYDNLRAGLPFTPTIGTATDGGTGTTVSVAFTGNNTAGLTYTALSTPGSLSATSTTSPITVTGLTSGTAYTFAVKATNSAGDSPYSAASNSVTPVDPASFVSIASATGNGTAASYTFSSLPSGYIAYQLRGQTIGTSAGATVYIAFNGDTGSSTLYSAHLLAGTGSTVAAGANVSVSSFTINGEYNGSSTTYATPFIVDISQPTSTTINKTVRIINGLDVNGTGGEVNLRSAARNSTNALTSINVSITSGNFATGSTFALYGIKA